MINIPSCPYCGHEGEASAMGENADRPPGDGDVTLCGGCHRWTMFVVTDVNASTTVVTLREPTDEESAQIAASPMMAAIQRAYRAHTQESPNPYTRVRQHREAHRGD